MINRILILTAETENFVPVELEKAAKAQNIEVSIVNVKKTFIVEELEGNASDNYKLTSGVYQISDKNELELIKVDSNTAIIPRLSYHHADIKIAMMKRFELLGATLLNSPEGMELCNDKLISQVILNSAQIKTPYSILMQNLKDIETIVDSLEKSKKITYPFIIKTLHGTHGIGVMKVDGRSSLISVSQTLLHNNTDFMIQEFCEHETSVRIIMIGDKVLAANLRGQPKDKDEFRTNSHLGSKTEKYEPSEAEVSLARRIVELFRCKFIAIDYIITKNKEIVILEVNGSPGLENIQKDYPDRNLAAEIITFISGKELPAERPSTQLTPIENPNDETSSDAETLIPNDTTVELTIDTVTDQPVEPQTDISSIKTINTDEPNKLPETYLCDNEPCTIHRIIDEPTAARIDTGAEYCSLHVDHIEILDQIVKFKRGDVSYMVNLHKTVKIKSANTDTSTTRPIVLLDITVKGCRENQVEFTLNDRSHMTYEILLGRKLLAKLQLPIVIDPTKKSEEE